MSDSPEYIADWLMMKLKDVTADCKDDSFKLSLEQLKKLCDQELIYLAEIEQDKIVNPHFYT
jgi:hypothetical protein